MSVYGMTLMLEIWVRMRDRGDGRIVLKEMMSFTCSRSRSITSDIWHETVLQTEGRGFHSVESTGRGRGVVLFWALAVAVAVVAVVALLVAIGGSSMTGMMAAMAQAEKTLELRMKQPILLLLRRWSS